MTQSDLIKELRGGLTQEEFATRVGDKQSAVSNYESERRAISLKKYLKWCRIIGGRIFLRLDD